MNPRPTFEFDFGGEIGRLPVCQADTLIFLRIEDGIRDRYHAAAREVHKAKRAGLDPVNPAHHAAIEAADQWLYRELASQISFAQVLDYARTARGMVDVAVECVVAANSDMPRDRARSLLPSMESVAALLDRANPPLPGTNDPTPPPGSLTTTSAATDHPAVPSPSANSPSSPPASTAAASMSGT